ncbi:MAG TPA: hypothetical protein VFZ96_02080 [Actinomycetota bacterium]|nr:hypothetical protein [Actinomycetota bacterium]
MRRDFLLYAGAIVIFGGVVLWAADASWEAILVAAVVAVALLAVAALLARPGPRLLVVGERPEEDLEPLRRELRADGFLLETCPGPESSACPAVSGRPCPAHGEPVAAVVIRHPGETGALAPCGEAFRIPELAVEEDSDREPEFVGRYGRVGLARGPQAVTDALDRLLEGSPA